MQVPLHEAKSPQAALLVLVPVLLASVLLMVCRFGNGKATARAREEMLGKLPSPRCRLPVIGHLHLVGSLPHVSLRDLAAQHDRDGLMLLRPDARRLLAGCRAGRAAHAHHVFASRPHSPVTDILFYGSTDVAFCPYGDHWRQVKKIATTHLLTARKVRSYRPTREHEVRLVMAKLRDAIGGATVDMSDLLNAFANDVVCHAVSGKSFRKQGHNKLFRELWRPTPPSSAATTATSSTSCFLFSKSTSVQYNLTKDHIKAQLVIMFEAGNPHLMAKLQAEVRSAIPKGKDDTVTEDDLYSLAYLKEVITLVEKATSVLVVL
ncbi:hypothetical protein ACQ4PT_062960 [Festuca glaucescens]